MSFLKALSAIRLTVTGARGPVGIDLDGNVTPGNFLVKAPGGSRKFIAASGTGADAGLRTDLAAPTGGSNIGIRSSIPTSAAIIDANKLGSRRADVRDWNGADLTGGNDGTSIMSDAFAQSAIAGVALESPAGIVTLTSPVELPAGGVFKGVSGLYMAGTFSGRTVLNIAHTGKGITMTGASGGRAIKHIATRRSQPAFASGWTPTAHDFDFVTNGATDAELEDILLINPTKGILCTGGGGRFSMKKIWGQPLNVGIQIDTSLDVSRILGMHFWDFWSSGKAGESYVQQYMIAKATAIWSKRNDNADFYDLFALGYRNGLRIGNFVGPTGAGDPSSGTTKRLRVFGAGFDACGSGFVLDGAQTDGTPAANGATAEIHGFYAHGHDTMFTDGNLIDVFGTNSDIRFYGKLDLSGAHHSAISVSGSLTGVTANDLIVDGFNMINDGHAYPGLYIDQAAFGLTLRGQISVNGGKGTTAPPQYGGTGRIYGEFMRDYVPAIAPSTGAFSAAAQVNSAVYCIVDGRCKGVVDFSIPNNGSGAGSIKMDLPLPTLSGKFDVGLGEEVALYGVNMRVHFPASSGNCQITRGSDNSYPAASGARFVVNFDYRAAL